MLGAIKARLNRHKVEQDLFRSTGPLGAFAARIDLALVMGIYSEQEHGFLHTIRRIRNEFAHTPAPLDFKSQNISDLAKNLWLKANIHIQGENTGQKVHIVIEGGQTAREMFLNAVKVLLLVLDMEIKQQPHRTPAPPVLRLLPGPPEQF